MVTVSDVTYMVYVYPDDENTIFRPLRPAAVKVEADPSYFVGAIRELSDQHEIPSKFPESAIRLLNLAKMNAAPAARILLAFSAIESLVHGDKWTTDERKCLDKIVSSVENDEICLDERSRQRIAKAIRRALPTGVTQGVVGLLQNLDLRSLERKWKALYGKRSKVMHGDLLLSEQDERDFSEDAIQFATTVILSAIRNSGIPLPSAAETKLRG